MKRIKIDRSKYIGCLTCVTACVVSHESCDSRNRVTIDSKTKATPIHIRFMKLKLKVMIMETIKREFIRMVKSMELLFRVIYPMKKY